MNPLTIDDVDEETLAILYNQPPPLRDISIPNSPIAVAASASASGSVASSIATSSSSNANPSASATNATSNPNATAAIPTNDKLASVEKALTACMESVWKMAMTVDGVQTSASSTAMYNHMQAYLQSLEQVDRVARACQPQLNARGYDENNVSIPANVLDCVDHGVNPDNATRALLQAVAMKNDAVRGNVFAVKSLADNLEARMNAWDTNHTTNST